jgi:hypothetical protein
VRKLHEVDNDVLIRHGHAEGLRIGLHHLHHHLRSLGIFLHSVEEALQRTLQLVLCGDGIVIYLDVESGPGPYFQGD